MSNRSIGLDGPLYDYLLTASLREHPVLARLREATAATGLAPTDPRRDAHHDVNRRRLQGLTRNPTRLSSPYLCLSAPPREPIFPAKRDEPERGGQ
ncbi:MAG: hypothetical protein ACNA8G_11685 [Gammaproteobacteria bacterium]